MTSPARNRLLTVFLLAFVVLLLSYERLAFYMRFDFNQILFLMAIPFVLKKHGSRGSMRYGIAAVFLMMLYAFVPLSTLFFFAFICSLFFMYEYNYGKLDLLPLFLLIVVSPVALFLSEIVGFEIRLWLTKIASYGLQFLNPGYSHSGNIITLGANEFRVDSECMGLKMITLSLFSALIFLSFRQFQTKKSFRLDLIAVTLASAFMLVVISNLFRIVIITLFESPPGSLSHELIGLMCFSFYVLLPLWYLVKKLPMQNKSSNPSLEVTDFKAGYVVLIVLLIGSFSYFKFTTEPVISNTEPTHFSLQEIGSDYSVSMEEHNVAKLTNEDYLIYIKPAASFYSAEHTPIICWKGSGYSLDKEEIIQTSTQKVFYGQLKKDEEVLFTSWWYDSGSKKTISQYDWRFDNLTSGSDYHLINVISHSKESVLKKTEELMNRNFLGER